MDVLPITKDLTLATVERPNEDDFVLASTAGGSRISIRDGGRISDAKLEGYLLLRKTKGLRRILDIVVNLVRAENVRHNYFRACESGRFRKTEQESGF